MTMEPLSLFRDGLPAVVTGVEHEYKWLIAGEDVAGFGAGTGAVLDSIGGPEGYACSLTSASTQSCVYFDTPDWDLMAAGISLAVIVNYGARRHLRWLTLKDTLLWTEGRRDTLEISERIDEKPVSRILADRTVQPLIWLGRRLGRPVDVRAYGAATQWRRQALLTSDAGCSVGLSLDETTVRDADGGCLTVDRWLEVETNQSDFRSLTALAAWARMVTAGLGTEPYERSKPARAAELVRGVHVGR